MIWGKKIGNAVEQELTQKYRNRVAACCREPKL